jgi:xylose isomerase
MTQFTLALLTLLALAGCTKTGANKEAALRDFNRLCQAQKDYLEARKLKGVDISALAVERAKRMGEGLETGAAFKAVELMTVAAQSEQRAVVEQSAKEAGLEGWSCPEFGQGQ